MNRRRALQTAALAFAGGIAGCNTTGGSSDDDPTETPELTATETPTETPTPTPREEPRGTDPPIYLQLLPRSFFKGTEGDGEYESDNAVFTKVDWEWHLENRETVPKFDAVSSENWSFRPFKGNFDRAPSADVLKTPVYGALNTAFKAEEELSINFPDISPIMREQLGLEADDEYREAAREIDEVVYSYSPEVLYYIGVDTDPIRDLLEDGPNMALREWSNGGNTKVYTNVFSEDPEDISDRLIIVTDYYDKGVVALKAENGPLTPYTAVGNRCAGGTARPASKLESVQWCLDELVDAPVVAGEVSGGRREFNDAPHGNRDIGAINPFETMFVGMDISEFSAVIQTIISDTERPAPSETELEEAFAENTGQYNTRYHPNVSSITATW